MSIIYTLSALCVIWMEMTSLSNQQPGHPDYLGPDSI